MGKHHVIIEGHHCLLHLAFYGLVISSAARRLLSLTGMAAWLGTSHEIGGEPAGGQATKHHDFFFGIFVQTVLETNYNFRYQHIRNRRK